MIVARLAIGTARRRRRAEQADPGHPAAARPGQTRRVAAPGSTALSQPAPPGPSRAQGAVAAPHPRHQQRPQRQHPRSAPVTAAIATAKAWGSAVSAPPCTKRADGRCDHRLPGIPRHLPGNRRPAPRRHGSEQSRRDTAGGRTAGPGDHRDSERYAISRETGDRYGTAIQLPAPDAGTARARSPVSGKMASASW